MSLIHFYYDPITELDCLFDSALAARLSPTSTKAKHATTTGHRDPYRPRLDIHESNDTNTVTATFELPGLTSEGVAIDVHQNRLTVSGDSASVNSDSQEEGANYTVRERRFGKFSRTLQLPFGIKPEDVKAKMENGILTITFPKTTPEQQAKRIAVQ